MELELTVNKAMQKKLDLIIAMWRRKVKARLCLRGERTWGDTLD
jgi:hypothetical protein